MSNLDKQASEHKKEYTSIEQKENNQVSKVKAEFNKKDSEYRTNISEIDKASNNEAKNFEATKKAVKRNYELSLAKNLSELNLKLQQDIKGL